MSVTKEIYLQYSQGGVPTNAYSVLLASFDGTYGIKDNYGNVLISSGTAVINSSTGNYQYTTTFQENTLYTVSWQVIPVSGDTPKYSIQQIGPFTSSATIRAIPDSRGTFVQGTRTTFFIRITDLNSDPKDPSIISTSIYDPNNNLVTSYIPERVDKGYYAYDWDTTSTQTIGNYTIVWNYTIDGNTSSTVQSFVVTTSPPQLSPPSKYSGRILEMRQSLELMIKYSQWIPVYKEQAKQSYDLKHFDFSFPRWNQSSGVKIYVNKSIIEENLTVDFNKGKVIFDNPLTQYDQVMADYNFRWFTDVELDRFMSNGLELVTLWPPVEPKYYLWNLEDRYIVLVLYAAAVDAIRNMMMSLQFQEPQLVFGGPERADKIYSQLEGLKKNYEEMLFKGLEQKKFGPYKGLTKTISSPSFAVPGSRSRWFRYLFSSGS